jgi:hypothetical protein
MHPVTLLGDVLNERGNQITQAFDCVGGFWLPKMCKCMYRVAKVPKPNHQY